MSHLTRSGLALRPYGWLMAPPWLWLTLDVETFDADAFEEVVDRCLRDGIVFTTIAELGDVDSNHRRLYDLNRTCSADIPERGKFFTMPSTWRSASTGIRTTRARS